MVVSKEAGVFFIFIFIWVVLIGFDDHVLEFVFFFLQDILLKVTLNKHTLPKVTTNKVRQSWDRHLGTTRDVLNATAVAAFCEDGEFLSFNFHAFMIFNGRFRLQFWFL